MIDGQAARSQGSVVSGQGTGPLPPKLREEIRELATRYPERRTALLPALKLAQTHRGYLPREIIADVADLVEVPHAAALELVSFYTMLLTEPGPARKLIVCAQLPCALRGAEALIRELEAGLHHQIEAGLLEVERTTECFGACHKAPMARLGDEYRESLTETARQKLIAELSG